LGLTGITSTEVDSSVTLLEVGTGDASTSDFKKMPLRNLTAGGPVVEISQLHSDRDKIRSLGSERLWEHARAR
jgi:hypothetical protein